MIFLGLDPGYARLGFGIVELNGTNLKHIEHGTFETDSGLQFPERLLQLEERIQKILARYDFSYCALEQVFFRKNLTTGVLLIQARGVVILTLARAKIQFSEVSPTSLKKALTGSGVAGKPQMQSMTARLLSLSAIPKPDDAADALALAVCAAFQSRSALHRKASVVSHVKKETL